MKYIFIAEILFLFIFFSSAQSQNNTQHSALGVHFFVNNFSRGDSNKFKPGLAISFMAGISSHVDFVAMLAGSFPKFETQNNNLLLESDAALRYKIFPDKFWISPFLQAGIGISKYNSTFGSYLPAGIGVQIKLFEEAYFISNAQYRLLVNSSLLDHFFFSIGVAGTINKKKKINKHLPVAENNISAKIPIMDSDGDGIPDSTDACPLVKGFIKYKGCPIPDSDGDGINDEEDSCPYVAGLAKYKGCPIPDRDSDGVNDEVDQCPDMPGTSANHGCPEISSTLINKINLAAKKIFFETGKYIILSESFSSLDTVASILQKDKNLKLNVSGHTDNIGTAENNQILSENRARAVVNYFIKKGIDKERLKYAGYGLTKPIADNSTIVGRAYNRRVEMELYYY
jgi:OmpA-OmpF porin, OOP family